MSIGEFVRIKKANFHFQWKTMYLYYPKSCRFALSDLALGFASLFYNPYRLSRKNGSVYGETPLVMLQRIASFCHLTANDSWLELGSGRGKGCFWISEFVGCRVAGIEKISRFVFIAKAISWIFGFQRLSFIKGDLGEADFSRASCVYLYSTCMEEDELERLARKMESLPPGARVVSVSGPLPETAHLLPSGSFPLSFPWGDTEGYLHVRVL